MTTLPPSTDIQITAVAKAVSPNLAPILEPRLQTKTVVLVHTRNFETQAKRLAKVYKRYQIKTVFEPISDAFDFEKLKAEFEAIILRYYDQTPLVNMTNGTKLMSLALYDVARTLELPTYYVNPDDTLSWLYPNDLPKLDLQDRISLPAFIEANGFEYLEDREPSGKPEYRQLLEWMVLNLESMKKAIPQLNYYASSADKDGISQKLKGDTYQLEYLIEQFSQAGVATLKNGCICFENEDARFFANGGWLEEHIHHQIRQLSAEVNLIQDYRASSVIETEDHSVRNEIDNMILVNNHLYLIECKTKKFTDRGHPEGGAMDPLYKMDTLMAELGGPLTRGMLVSVFPFTPAEKNRAKEYNIQLVDYDDLPQLKARLKQWFAIPMQTQ